MNPIPNTGLSVSPITLGTMTYGNPVAFDDAVDLTRYALAQGINMIDTANMYEGYDRVPGSAGGVAERIIGRAIQGLDRRGVLIATKLGMKVGDSPEDAGTSASAVHTQLSRSLERLGTDYVDLYYLHCPDPSVPLEETLRAIDEELHIFSHFSSHEHDLISRLSADARVDLVENIRSDRLFIHFLYCRKGDIGRKTYKHLVVGVIDNVSAYTVKFTFLYG